MHSQDILRPRHTRDGYYLRKSERNILNLAYRQYKHQKRSLFRVHAHACANHCVLYTPCRGVNTCNVLITRLEVSVRRLHPSTTHATGWMATTFLETGSVSCFSLACLKIVIMSFIWIGPRRLREVLCDLFSLVISHRLSPIVSNATLRDELPYGQLNPRSGLGRSEGKKDLLSSTGHTTTISVRGVLCSPDWLFEVNLNPTTILCSKCVKYNPRCQSIDKCTRKHGKVVKYV